MSAPSEVKPAAIDISACEREPIHIPGSIQPHGVLLALAEDGSVLQASENVELLFGVKLQDVLRRPLYEALGEAAAGAILKKIASTAIENNPVLLETIERNGSTFHAIAHRHAGSLILEFECANEPSTSVLANVFPMLREFLAQLHVARTTAAAAEAAVREIRRMTGFDRVLVYRFDSTWNGHVIAEDRDPALTSYLDLWFPASDIPPQARQLYRLNRSRLIADASYRPAAVLPSVNPQTGAPLDLTYSALRSVSPVHIEYLHNMGVAASMSFSILAEGELWGLISCHHRTPRPARFAVREACDFAAQSLANIVYAREQQSEYEHSLEVKSIMTRLLAYMAEEEHFIDGLRGHGSEVLAFAEAGGAAIVWEDSCTLIGATPTEDQVLALTDWLVGQGREDLFHTDCAGTDAPGGEFFSGPASGILAISVSKLYRGYVLWFRPEVVRTVTWGGDPHKAAEPSGKSDRLHPRKSFEAWKEVVRGRSQPWRASDVEASRDLRNAIIGIVLRKAEELGQLSAELQRSNQELEAFSYSVSHDLRAPFRHIVGYAEMLQDALTDRLDDRTERYIQTIIESAHFAGTLVDNLLNLSRIGRSRLNTSSIDMNELTAEMIAEFEVETAGRSVEWKVGPLPRIAGDLLMIRTALQNLISNAIKYTGPREHAVIRIAASENETEWIFSIADNGIGFDPRYVDKLFGVFQRLHRMEDFEGTGIGLANVRRIAGRHGGRTWADGKPDAGATFYFTVAKRLPERTS